jgi:hypothetical protein
MKYLLFIILLVATLITTGCVSENKNTTVALTSPLTETPTLTPEIKLSTLDPSEMALQLSDLPEGYIKKSSEQGETSYNVEFIKGSSTFDYVRISQGITVTHNPDLDKSMNFLREDFRKKNSTELSNPNIGDSSIAARKHLSTGESFGIFFIKKDVVEFLSSDGSQTDYELLKTLAKKAADKIK